MVPVLLAGVALVELQAWALARCGHPKPSKLNDEHTMLSLYQNDNNHNSHNI